MKNNPVIPYILILAFGIGLIFFLSVEGVDNKKEIAAGNATEETTTGGEKAGGKTDGGGEAKDGETLTASCIGCHAADFTGGTGPKLAGGAVDAARIEDVLVNGLPGSTFMTAGKATPEDAKVIAEYITTNFK